MPFSKVTIRRLPIVAPPIPDGGGRVVSEAGELTQIVNGDQFRFLAYIEFKPNASTMRGNHFHAKKVENLYIITGRLHAYYVDLDTGERFETELATGDFVTVQPNCAHAYQALEHAHAVEVNENAYDPADTIPYKIFNGTDGRAV